MVFSIHIKMSLQAYNVKKNGSMEKPKTSNVLRHDAVSAGKQLLVI